MVATRSGRAAWATTAYHPSVVRLADGRVLVVGGYDIDRDGEPLAVTELYR